MSATLTRRFWRHYAQMVLVMLAGMAVLGIPAGLAFPDQSTGEMLAVMAATMTAPMIPYMRWMGHGWRPTLEMTAAMVVPALGTLALLAADAVTGVGALMTIEHVAMFGGMFAVMAARPEEYSHCSPYPARV
jgi:flagellar biosynthetic protein FliP